MDDSRKSRRPSEWRTHSLDSILDKLITANHILHYHGIIDAYGHLSVRNPTNPTSFLISKDLAPALVSRREDIEAYHISDASPLSSDAPKGYAERFIHSEIYKQYADVDVIIHSHNEAVLPFSITSVPLRPVYHMAGAMGARVPVFDISLHYKATDTSHSMLVNNQHLGAALAHGFHPPSLTTKVYNYLTSASPEPTAWPLHSTVLMRGHGFTCIGRSIEEATFRAVYTCNNARVQLSALSIQATHNLSSIAARLGPTDKLAGAVLQGDVHYLSDRECKDSWDTLRNSIDRPWKLWCEEVARCKLYTNGLATPGSVRS